MSENCVKQYTELFQSHFPRIRRQDCQVSHFTSLTGKLTGGGNGLFKAVILHLIPRNHMGAQNNDYQALWHAAAIRESIT